MMQSFRKTHSAGLLTAALLFCAAVLPGQAAAGDVEIVDAVAYADLGDKWRFDVTLRHGDTGWEHYADRWDVLAPDGGLLGSRTLFHPHVNEQPFTRSLSGVAIPPEINHVMIRANDTLHGESPQLFKVDLPR